MRTFRRRRLLDQIREWIRSLLPVRLALAAQILALSVLTTSAPAAQKPWFSAREDSSAGTSPQSLVVADFNGDGVPDEAVANFGSNNVSVLIGNGDGTFRAPVNYAVGTGPTSIAVGDFNRDGKLDLVVANSGSNNVSILLGNGNGTFYAEGSYRVGTQPAFVTVADFNHDGRLDLSVANENCVSGSCGDGSVSILLGNGNGTFAAAVEYSVGLQPVAIAAGDFNADGHIDLAVVDENCPGGCGSGLVSILLGNGDGTFQNSGFYPQVGTQPVSVTMGDFNGDGKPDLAVVNQNCYNAGECGTGSVSILLGEGNGDFSSGATYPLGTDPTSIAAADLNHDGKLDLVAAGASCSGNCARNPGLVHSLLGNGDGTFQTPRSFPIGEIPAFIAVGDFNGDGALDVATANSQGFGVSVLLGNGNGSFQEEPEYTAGAFANGLAVADFNGDGKLDLAVGIKGGSVSVFVGNGNGTFQAAHNLSFAPYTYPVFVIAADFNGDGKPDLAVLADKLWVAMGKGDGTFAPATSYSPAQGLIGAAVGDFNGDGKLDLVAIGNNSNSVAVLLGNGDGTFRTAHLFATATAPTWVTVGDFNNDGKLDIATSSNTDNGPVSILLGNGDGTFQPAQAAAVGSGFAITIGDFNGDGNLDLAVAQTGADYQGTVALLLGKGDGTFQPPRTFSVGTFAYAIVAADFNGDGKLDVATVSFDSNSASVLLGNGDGTFQPARSFGADSSPVGVAVGDFNGKGKPDLAVTNISGGDVSVLINTYSAPAPAAAQTTLSPTSLSFGNQTVKTTSSPKTVTLTNQGSAAVTVSIAASAGFFETNTCEGQVAAHGSCTISVTFSPQAAGTLHGDLTVTISGVAQAVTLQGTGTVPVITLSPTSASVAFGHSQTFTATISNASNTTLNWYVNGVLNGNSTQGTLTGTNLSRTYTAPSGNVPSPNPAVIKVVSAADPSVFKTAGVTVTDSITVTLNPPAATEPLGHTQAFTATISGAANTSLSWYVNGVLNGNSTEGSLTGTNLKRTYTAPPAHVPSPNPVVIKVASHADPAKYKTAKVTVTSP